MIPVPEVREAPASVALGPGEVHLWQASLAGEEDLALLPPDEVARAEQLRVAGPRLRFVRSRTLLRTVLAAYTGLPPRELRFAPRGQGKPALREEAAVRFNLSRTDAEWMLAVAADREVGVDVERVDRRIDADALAARLFSVREREILRKLAGSAKTGAFFRAWACREAVVKAMGEGMFSHSHRFEVEADPGRPVAAWAADGGEFPWWLGVAPAGPDHVAVLAAEGAPSVVRSWRLA